MISKRQWWIAGIVGIILTLCRRVVDACPPGSACWPSVILPSSLLLFIAFLLMVANAVSTRGQVRLFWGLMALGCLLWSTNLALWTLYEVILRRTIPDPFIGDVDPLCSRRAVHGGGGVASPPVGGKETLLQHPELPDAAGVVGFPVRLHRVSRRVCSAQCCGLQPALRPALPGGKSGLPGGAGHTGMECAERLEENLLEPVCCFGTLRREFGGAECRHRSRAISHRQHL